jgi:hypothetical protein
MGGGRYPGDVGKAAGSTGCDKRGAGEQAGHEQRPILRFDTLAPLYGHRTAG